MGHAGKLEGEVVSEEEVSKGLGFKDVTEFRRWQTIEGQRYWLLESKYKEKKRDADNFQWHIKRMQLVLNKVYDYLNGNEEISREDLMLAIKVVNGGGVDWDKKLTWLKV